MGNIFNESAVNGRKRNLKMGDKGQNSCDVFSPDCIDKIPETTNDAITRRGAKWGPYTIK